MEVSGQLHTPDVLPPGKEPPVPNGKEAGWAPGPQPLLGIESSDNDFFVMEIGKGKVKVILVL
jgi:hypothetical protein